MTTEFSHTAKIYQFPVGGRKAVGGAETKPVAELMSPRASVDTFGSAWYHEAAIQQSNRPREH